MVVLSKMANFMIAALTLWEVQLLSSVDAFGVATLGTACGGSVSSLPPNYFVSSPSSTRLFAAALPEGYQEFGDTAIREAARQCGMVFDNDDDDESQNQNRLDTEWKAGSIIVTVQGEVSLSTGASNSGDDDEENKDDDDVVDEGDDELPFGDLEGENDDEPQQQEEFSLSLLARTINKLLDDDGIGLAIAEVHSIEVTTPGVKDELVPGTPQFDAFKGFEVIVQQLDTKTNKLKTIEGRLVERNDEFTIINMKGRMKKLKNETVQSVRLPKAKKEKGAR